MTDNQKEGFTNTKDELLEEEKDFIEQDFAGKVKTIVRALCPWPEWKVFWEIKMSTYYKLITGKTSRIFDFLAISNRNGVLHIFEVKRTWTHAKKSLEYQINQDSMYSDKIYVIAPEDIIDKIEGLVPEFVGLISVPVMGTKVSKKDVRADYILRKAKQNPKQEAKAKLLLLKDLDATIGSWHDRVMKAVLAYSKKLCKDCDNDCIEEAKNVRSLVLCQLTRGGNIDNEIETYSISKALNISEDEIRGIVKALPCLSGIRIKERNDLLQFKEICEEDSRDYFRKRHTELVGVKRWHEKRGVEND